MKSLFLTGVTGMLGHFLLRDCLLAGRRVIIVARKQRSFSARHRVNQVISELEHLEQRYLPRPIVLEGDIHQPMLGLSPTDINWVAENCDTILHSAASVKFFAEQPENQLPNGPQNPHNPDIQQVEPYLSNVTGTRNLLDFCRSTGIVSFHHISTAYVCGQQTGVVLEQPVNQVQFGNDYEASKAESESLIRNARFLKSRTFLRPSIIVGDSRTGFAPSFQAIYTALQLGYLFVVGAVRSGVTITENMIKSHFVEQLGLTGNEQKNLVPADWVSSVIMQVVRNPLLHDKTYHITNHKPVCVSEIIASMRDAIMSCVNQDNGVNKTGVPGELLEFQGFRSLMNSYRSYFCDDPQFDSAHTQGIPSVNVCPNLDHDTLIRIWTHAINQQFSSRRHPLPSELTLDIDRLLAEAFERRSRVSDAQNGEKRQTVYCLLQVSGPGGGAWQIGLQKNGTEFELATVDRTNLENEHTVRFDINSVALVALLNGQIGLEDAFYSGQLFVESPILSAGDLQSLAEQMLGTIIRAMREDANESNGGIRPQWPAVKGAIN